jgi:hypothetical protein
MLSAPPFVPIADGGLVVVYVAVFSWPRFSLFRRGSWWWWWSVAVISVAFRPVVCGFSDMGWILFLSFCKLPTDLDCGVWVLEVVVAPTSVVLAAGLPMFLDEPKP